MSRNNAVKEWQEYIIKHPERWIAIKGHIAIICAPYKEISLRQSMEGQGIIFFDNDKGVDHWHRLDGPAFIGENDRTHYYIDDIEIDEQKYWKHPLVIQYKVDSLIKEILKDYDNVDINKNTNTGDENG